jgi:hypothetical protein
MEGEIKMQNEKKKKDTTYLNKDLTLQELNEVASDLWPWDLEFLLGFAKLIHEHEERHEPFLLSLPALAKDWLIPADEEAWKDL